MTLIVRGYKTELKLNNAQRTACLKHAGTSRYAYNWGLRRYQEERAAGRKAPTAMSLHKELNALKQGELSWMYEVSKAAPQESLRDLEHAFKHFWKRCAKKQQGRWRGKLGYPRFKSKKRGIGSFRLTGAIHVGEDWVQLPRLGKLRLKERGYLPTTGVHILSATVSERAGRWYVSLQVEEEHAEAAIALGETIGIDLGIKALATLSDGRVFGNPKALGSHLKQLRRLSRQHARKQLGSKNRQKAARKLARLHAHIANLRQDTVHQVTALIVAKTKPDQQRPTCIVLEDLQVSSMVKNRNLSRAIADVGFAEFRRQLEYKAQQAGSLVYTVSQWEPSSKTCSWCGWIDEDLTLSDRLFHCEACGSVIDRDRNASINLALKAAG
ncbi:RNA-guided endonuclease InsQ/TnpB family protein [Dictyobacter aurantiacus]|uniref:Transposase n=1 Tax=Dictyobacter aurantiacus TaxID=1936993 RepID=A0A401ZR79_9CHLR|nr:RNA-guided endonuclease TnpB family protein [Dictyobacter aurantiacus]GCE09379.1 transposase [Dictyobacter aurantiacus]